MNNKIVTYVSIAAAVVVAAIAAIVVTNDREAVARARAQAEEAARREATTKREAEKMCENAQAAADALANAVDALAGAAEDNRKAKEAEANAAEANADAEADKRKKEELAAQRLRDDAKVAEEKRKAKEAEAETARRAAEAVRMKAEKAKSDARAAADALAAERMRSERSELRKDYEAVCRELFELRQELDERDRAPRPDITVADLMLPDDGEPDIIGEDTNAVTQIKKAKVLPEDDTSLPEATRRLAKTEREMRETLADGDCSVSNRIVKSLTRLYNQAKRDGRTIDAEFYSNSIKQYYPNWKDPDKKDLKEKEKP